MAENPRSPENRPPLAAHPDLEWRETIQGSRPGDRFVKIAVHKGFSRVRPGYLTPRPGTDEPKSGVGRALQGVKRFLIGTPLPSSQEGEQRLGKVKGLSIMASDNISSSAYASEEIMRVLVLAGALALTMPTTLAIIAVLIIVVTSYQQVIRTYPSGGGSYVVASDNLGAIPGLVAAGALLTDYVLTVAVSTAAGVAALTSIFPELYGMRVTIGVTFIALLCLGNLRGIRESGMLFAGPTYVYLAAILGVLGYGVVLAFTGNLPPYHPPAEWVDAHGTDALTLLLLLRAFSSGSVALTGVEAVSNGVPSFKPPEARNAQVVLIVMGVLFGTIFVGISFLASLMGIVPDPHEQETVLSQITRTLVGAGTPYHYLMQFSTALILVLAANTAYSGFPLLAGILARDRYLPRQFQFRGDRLDYSTGIIILTLLAVVLIVAFQGSVTSLIPLYTVGVFMAFTLSQSGMVLHWWRRKNESGWQWRLVVNGMGAIVTGTVMLVVAVAKFALGAWIVLILIPAFVGMMYAINTHYRRLDYARRATTPLFPESVVVQAVVPIADLGVEAHQAIAFARAIAKDDTHVVAVHVTDDAASAERLRREWAEWDPGLELIIIESPYRSLAGPLLAYVEALRETHPGNTITVVIPEFVPSHWWEHLLHNQTALRLKAALLFHPSIVVVNVPYHLDRNKSAASSGSRN